MIALSLRLVVLIFLAGALAACGGSGSGPTTPPGPATVEFAYQAATAIDPAVAAQFPGCVAGVGRTHIHPSWRGYGRIDMVAAGADRWLLAFADVPTGSEQRIRVSDPNACARDPNGASTENVFANGVLLTRIVPTPGNGIEPGLAFSVAANGTVTP